MLNITLVYAPAPRQVLEYALQVVSGATVNDVIYASALTLQFPDLLTSEWLVGIWNEQVGLTHVVRDLDRIEIYRPLKVDPKIARRERFARQGVRTSGLFAKRRPGGKAGY